MRGWRRLWVVLSVLLGIPTAMIAYDVHKRASEHIPYTGNNTAFWEEAHRASALRDCNWNSATVERELTDGFVVSCETKAPEDTALVFAFLPAVIMAAIGLTIRWVYRGFRPVSKQGE